MHKNSMHVQIDSTTKILEKTYKEVDTQAYAIIVKLDQEAVKKLGSNYQKNLLEEQGVSAIDESKLPKGTTL